MNAVPAIKLCSKCAAKFKKAAAKGGRNGSKTDKRRASRLAVIARAENARKLTLNGESMTVAQWAAKTGIPKTTLWKRLARPKPLTVAQVLAR